MLPPSIQTTVKLPAILGDPTGIIKTTSTLCRLIQLHKIVEGQSNAQEIRSKLSRVWLESIESIDSGMNLIELKKSIFENLKNSSIPNEISNKIELLYGKKINKSNESNIKNILNEFLNDSHSIQTKPATKSSKGVNGPTILASYPRIEKIAQNIDLDKYVVKWSDLTEICSTRLYENISQFLASKGKSHLFHVPRSACLDLENCVHEAVDRSKSTISDDEHRKLSKNIAKVFNFFIPSPRDEPIEDERILLMERVEGSNFEDFVKYKYDALTFEQKAKLFTYIGKLAILDLITGSNDRFIQTEYDESQAEFVLTNNASNPGNAMISWLGDKDEPTFYAIDNAISWVLIDPESPEKVQYNEFLNKLFKEDDYINQMAKSVSESIAAALEITDTKGSPELVEKKQLLEKFMQDLKGMSLNFLGQGMEEMAFQLTDYLNSDFDQKHKLEKYLNEELPELQETLAERFEIFKLARKPT